MGARSTGCVTCKKRKVKCSEERPACKQCRARGLDCGGYKSILRFVDETPRIERKKQVVAAQINDFYRVSTPNLLQDYNCTAFKISPCTTIHRTVRGEFLISFLIMKLTGGRKLSDSKNSWGIGDPGVWLNEMLKMPHQSLDALAAIFYGRANHMKQVVLSALCSYGNALTSIRQSLGGVEGAMLAVDFGTLASITTLCMFELANNRSGKGWIFHAQCLERLLEFYGPPRKMNSPEHSLFLMQRTILMSQAIVSQRKTILSKDKWRCIPWEANPTSKLPFDFLVDIVCDIADVRVEVKELLQHFDKERYGATKTKALATMSDLDSWWNEWALMNPRACWAVKTNTQSTVLVDSDGPLYTTSLEYTSIDAAYIVSAYDAARILLLQVLTSLGLQAALDTVQNDPIQCSLLGISSNMSGLAHEIVRSIEYCSTQSGHFMGSFSGILILDIAYSALEKGSRVRKWLLRNSRLGPDSFEEEYADRKDTLEIAMLPTCQLASRSRFVDE